MDLYEHRSKKLMQGFGLETLRDRRNVSRISFPLRAVQR